MNVGVETGHFILGLARRYAALGSACLNTTRL